MNADPSLNGTISSQCRLIFRLLTGGYGNVYVTIGGLNRQELMVSAFIGGEN